MKWVPDIDKQGHVWAGWALCLTFSLSFGHLLSGLLVTLGVAVLREAIGNHDMGDFLATTLGALIGVVVLMGAA